mmetsp:Transcript_22325/g.44707  ORF Transcript_22325/g.44707 Transcript_22325/m.44707 type:complete len:87 (-) Transcript_22325:122-382(-)
MSRAAAAMPKLKLRSEEANDDMTLVSVLTPVPPLLIQLPRTWNQETSADGPKSPPFSDPRGVWGEYQRDGLSPSERLMPIWLLDND